MKDIVAYFDRLKTHGSKLGLERMEKLLKKIGHPEKSFKTILVAGTNGKGSTVAMTAKILDEAGFKVGRYTSPHLTSLNERIVVDEKQIKDDELFRIAKLIRKKINKKNQLTFFEFITAVAFVYFKEKKVDFAVLEVGMGGRLDATNVVNPLVSIITNVSLEHTEILGDTVEKIAFEKGGIVKPNGVLVTAAEGAALKTLKMICRERKSKIVDTNGKTTNMKLSLIGKHQVKNACCAIGAVEELLKHGISIPEDAIRKGLVNVEWPGRMEIVQTKPTVILDCAKDADAAEKLAEAVKEELGINSNALILVISISADKNISRMMRALAPLAHHTIVTSHKVAGRAASPQIIAKELEKDGKEYEIVPDVEDAVKKAIKIAGKDRYVLVTGSVFTVAEARRIWFDKHESKLGLQFNDIPKR